MPTQHHYDGCPCYKRVVGCVEGQVLQTQKQTTWNKGKYDHQPGHPMLHVMIRDLNYLTDINMGE